MNHPNTIPTGFTYFVEGFTLISQTGLRRFILIPILANFLIFITLTSLLIQHYSDLSQWFKSLVDYWSWLNFLATFVAAVLTVLLIFIFMLIYGFSFNIITNIIGAPFYGLLAEKIEYRISGVTAPAESLGQLILRTVIRELIKLWYFVSRGVLVALGLFILAFIPLFNLLVPILALTWAAWVMALQYADYPADNHQLGFPRLRAALTQHRWSTLGFGGSVMLGSMIPVVNIFVMPIAVAGGTVMWSKEVFPQYDKERGIENP